MNFFETIILGAAQGVFEWLPISSEGVIILIKSNFFGGESLSSSIEMAIFLHLGTMTSAIVFFWDDIKRITKNIFSYKSSDLFAKKEINFYFFATLISALVGFVILELIKNFENLFVSSTFAINIIIALSLFVTAYLLSIKKINNTRTINETNTKDALIVGFFQGITPIPGLSRSGTTTSILLLRKIKNEEALRISFLMSVPIILFANIFFLVKGFEVTPQLFVGLVTSFLFGYVTIKLLLKIARRLNFSIFVLFFAIIVLLSSFV